MSCMDIVWDYKFSYSSKISPNRLSMHWWFLLESIIMMLARWWYFYSIIHSTFKTHKTMQNVHANVEEGKPYIFMFKLPQMWPVVAFSSWLHVLLTCPHYSLRTSFLSEQDVPSSSCSFLLQTWNQTFSIEALIPFREQWYLETKIWVLVGVGVHIAIRIVIAPGCPQGTVRSCMHIYKYTYRHAHINI